MSVSAFEFPTLGSVKERLGQRGRAFIGAIFVIYCCEYLRMLFGGFIINYYYAIRVWSFLGHGRGVQFFLVQVHFVCPFSPSVLPMQISKRKERRFARGCVHDY